MPEPIVMKKRLAGMWWGWEDGQIHPVYMTGTGYTMIRLDDLAGIDCPTFETDDGKTVRAFFGSRENYTDDFWLADLLEEQGKQWFVHGGVVCDQINRGGQFFRIESAKQKVMA